MHLHLQKFYIYSSQVLKAIGLDSFRFDWKLNKIDDENGFNNRTQLDPHIRLEKRKELMCEKSSIQIVIYCVFLFFLFQPQIELCKNCEL